MYIECTGRRIGGKFGEHLRSLEGHHQQRLYFICICIPPLSPPLPPSLVELQVFNLPDHKKRKEERTHFRPTFLPRGINTEFKIYVVFSSLVSKPTYKSRRRSKIYLELHDLSLAKERKQL